MRRHPSSASELARGKASEKGPPLAGISEPDNFRSGSDRPFVPGFALSILAPFGLFGRPLSLAAISVAPSPHPKIPFLADKAWRTALRGWGLSAYPPLL